MIPIPAASSHSCSAGAIRKLSTSPAAVEAADENPLLCAFLERLQGYALVQARRTEKAGSHLKRSLELARGLSAAAESTAILERFRVLTRPLVPLPEGG